MPNYTGSWSRQQQLQSVQSGLWPSVPGAPTGVTATNAGTTSISVAFTAPTNTGVPSTITGYTVTSSPGGITATGSSSPIVVTGLTTGTAYTFTVTATNATGTSAASDASNSATPAVVQGQQLFSDAGTFTFTVPSGVTSISAVTVGTGCDSNGSPRHGGGLAYVNNISVTPGESLTVVVATITNSYWAYSSVERSGTALVKATSGFQGNRGGPVVGSGGTGGIGQYYAGAGAGGYAGNGGDGGGNTSNGTAGSGGGGGGGGGMGGGGGVGVYGQGSSGAGSSTVLWSSAGSPTNYGNWYRGGGYGGSGGANGQTPTGYTNYTDSNGDPATTLNGGNGGAYGGSGASGGNGGPRGTAGGGAVRIIWPGTTRYFPSTNTSNV